MNGFTIGKLANKAGVNVETIRYYQRRRLLREPIRPASGFRNYSAGDVRRIQFIKHAQELGFTLNEIKELLSLRADSPSACAQVESKTESKIHDIDRRIKSLKQIRSALLKLKKSCKENSPLAACPVFESLGEYNK